MLSNSQPSKRNKRIPAIEISGHESSSSPPQNPGQFAFPPMATTAAPQASCSLIRRKGHSGDHLGEDCLKIGVRTRSPRNNSNLRVFASQGGRRRPRPPPGEYDPRLHSGTGDEGWIGGTASSQQTKQKLNEEKKGNVLGDKFADLLNESDSHYQ